MRSNLIRMANDIAIFHRSFVEGFQKEPAAFDKLVAKSLGKISCKTYNPIVPEIRELSGTGG